ncbi:hypothetical protein DFH05DRAFT_1458890 [Lentinula detonsa]|uniref:Uncharacterized protein n=1 Tax=Lentinula detonsa TaxID=2804962 RepID=A0A9W8P4Q6_9AGAR|nr:hypothetical protein DFH05DRAFT_1458890 [Lentinula detonsa]
MTAGNLHPEKSLARLSLSEQALYKDSHGYLEFELSLFLKQEWLTNLAFDNDRLTSCQMKYCPPLSRVACQAPYWFTNDLDDDGIFVPRGAENVIASDATEANVLNLVFGKTKIPVPRMRQWGNFFIVKHYIEGQLLADFWLTYTIWQKIGVAFTLRRYVRQAKQLRAILRR